jgi:hypothetical protein
MHALRHTLVLTQALKAAVDASVEQPTANFTFI